MSNLATTEDVIHGLRAALSAQPNATNLRSWCGLADGSLTLDQFYERELALRELTFLSLDTTGVCDLKCPTMCYYNPAINIRQKFVSEDCLKGAIRDANAELDLKVLVFSGKEPLLNFRRLFELASFAATIRDRCFSIGVVTNGRHLLRHHEAVTELAEHHALDFIDISLDSGFAAQHDSIRGVPGTFALAFAALQETVKIPDLRVGVSSVLRKDNREGILELLKKASQVTHWFNIQPIQPPPFTTTEPISLAELVHFLRELLGLLDTDLADAGLELTVVLHGPYVHEAVRSGFFSWSDLRESSEGRTYAAREISGNNLLFDATVLPDYGWRQARITYTGAYLAHAHFLQAPSPEKYAVGYIQDEPLLSLYNKAKTIDSHAHQLLLSRSRHACMGRPCWDSCFGGWTVSENAFLSNYPLTAQPRLCLKTERDFVQLHARIPE